METAFEVIKSLVAVVVIMFIMVMCGMGTNNRDRY
jgi:hypothetical protein